MSARSWAAARLESLVRERTGVALVTCRWRGNGADRRFSGWRLAWRDGPTEPEMRRVVGSLAHRVPALDVPDLGFDRVTTELSEAIALLLYVNSHRNEARHVNGFVRKWAIHKISYPELAGELWQCRARALLAGEEAFYARVRHPCRGWELALGWLDTVAGVNPIDVPSIAQAHERRHRYR